MIYLILNYSLLLFFLLSLPYVFASQCPSPLGYIPSHHFICNRRNIIHPWPIILLQCVYTLPSKDNKQIQSYTILGGGGAFIPFFIWSTCNAFPQSEDTSVNNDSTVISLYLSHLIYSLSLPPPLPSRSLGQEETGNPAFIPSTPLHVPPSE